MTLRWALLMSLGLLWGTAFLFNELALASFSPSVLVGGRIVIATALIYGYLRLTGETLPPSSGEVDGQFPQ